MKAAGSSVVLLLVSATAFAQEPQRPKLDATADTNDWEAYDDFGLRHLQRFRLAYHMHLVRAPRNATNRSLATRRLAAPDAPTAKR